MADGGTYEFKLKANTEFTADFTHLERSLSKVAKELSSKLGTAGKRALKELESDFAKGLDAPVDAFRKAIKEIASLAGSVDLGDMASGLEAQLKELVKMFEGIGGGNISREVGARFQAGRGLGDFNLGAQEEDAQRLLRAVKSIGDAFRQLQDDIKATTQLTETSLKAITEYASKLVSQDIVGMQEVMSQRRAMVQAEADLRRQENISSRHDNAMQELQEKQLAATKRELMKRETAELQSSLKQDNLALNAYYQQQVVKTKESLDRRQQLQRFFLDSTRSVFRTMSGAVSGVWKGMYSTIASIAGRGEGGLLSLVINRSKDRTKIYEAEGKARGDMMSRFSEQGDKGVLAALAGTSRAGGMLRSMAAGAGAGLGFGAVFNIGSDFMEQLNVTAALTNATTKEFQALRQASIDLGKDVALPGISAKDAAESMGMLARSGFSVRDSIDAARGVLSLARGNQLDFGQASEIVGKSLNVFGIKAKNATQIADAFTGALALAPQSIDEIKNAIARGGGAFVSFQKNNASAQKNLEQFLATSSSLIKLTGRSGEEVGTGIKRFFEVFQNPTGPARDAIERLSKAAGIEGGNAFNNIMFDAEGKVRKFSDTVALLKKGVANYGTEQDRVADIGAIFGSEAAGIANALASEGFNLQEATSQLRRNGDAAKLAAARNAGLKGAFDALKSQFETFAILIYEKVDKPLGNIVTGIATLIDKIANGTGIFQTLRTALLGAAAGLAALAAVKGAGEAFNYLKIAMSGVLSPLGIISIIAAGAGAAFMLLYKNSKPFRETIDQIKKSIGEFVKTTVSKLLPILDNIVKTVLNVVGGALKPFLQSLDTVFVAARNIFSALGNLAAAGFAIVLDAVNQVVDAFKGGKVEGIFGSIGRFAGNAFQAIREGVESVTGFLKTAAEGIYAAYRADGIIGVITLPFKVVKARIGEFFKDFDFGKFLLGLLNGIRKTFEVVGRRIGLIVGSNEFRNALLVAVGTIGGILGSAVLGLLQGVVDGLRKSELGKKIGDFLKDLINPVEIIKSIFGALMGNPSSIVMTILRGGLLVALMLLAKKIKDIFEKGTGGLKVAMKFATGDTAGAKKSLDEIKKKSLEAAKTAATFGKDVDAAFGSGFINKIVSASNAFGKSKFAERLRDLNSAIGSIAATRGVSKFSAFAGIIGASLAPAVPVVKGLAEKLSMQFSNLRNTVYGVAEAVRNGAGKLRTEVGKFVEAYGRMREMRKVNATDIIRGNMGRLANSVREFGRKVGTEISWLRDDISKKLNETQKSTRMRLVFFLYEFSKSDRGRAIIDYTRGIARNLTIGTRLVVDRVKQFANDVRDSFQIAGKAVTGGGNKIATATDSKLVPALRDMAKKLQTAVRNVTTRVMDSQFVARLREVGTNITNALGKGLISGAVGAAGFAYKATNWVSARRQELMGAIKAGFGREVLANAPELGGLGIAAGGGLAALIVGESPQAKFAGLTAAIFGVTQTISVAKTMAEQFGTALTGIATGGIVAVFAAVSFAVGIFAKRQQEAKRRAEELQQTVQNLRPVFGDLIERFGSSGRAIRRGFATTISASSDEVAKKLVSMSRSAGVSLDTLAGAYSRGSAGVAKFVETQRDQLADLEDQQRRYRRTLAATRGGTPGARAELAELNDQVAKKKEYIALVKSGGKALQEEIRLGQAKSKLDRAAEEITRRNQTNLERNRDKTREWRDAADQLKQALIDAYNAGKPVETQQALDDTAAASERFFSVLKENKLTLDNFNQGLGQGPRDARAAYKETTDAIAGIISSMEAQNASQKDINAALDLQKQKLIENAVQQGVLPEKARQFFETIFAGYRASARATDRFITRNRDGLVALGRVVDSELRRKLMTAVDGAGITGKLRDAVNAFLLEPTAPKNIDALLNLGVSQAQLINFIKSPSTKTIVGLLRPDTAEFDSAMRRIRRDAANNPVIVGIDVPGANPTRRIIPRVNSANGRVVNSPMLSWLGEGYKPEVVIPLTKPKRAVELYQQSGLEKVLAQGGLNSRRMMPAGKTSNVTVNQTFHVNGDTNLRKASRRAKSSGYDLGRQLRGL